MKLRWKDHELFFVTILAVERIVSYTAAVYAPEISRESYSGQQGRGDVVRNILLPQVVSVLLLYVTYLGIVFFIVPLIRKLRFADIETVISLNTLKVVASVGVLSFLLALVINALGVYAQPWLYNYAGFGIMAIFGYNDHPLENIFSGFGRAFTLISIASLVVCIREFISWLIIRKEAGRDYRVMIANNITALVLIYFVGLVLTNPTNYSFRLYIAYVTPVMALFVYLTFWVFPKTNIYALKDRRIWLRIFIATILCLLFPGIALGNAHLTFQHFVFWLALVVVVTPLTWLLYRLRAEQISQLRGMQTALAKSTANLQHLRSQINPHFLFNALNTLYGTALVEKAEKTAEGIQRLGDMMRFMLHENSKDFISMEKELEYMKNYLSLQKLRTASSSLITIEDNIEEVKCNSTIAPMLLIPFVENAFKHGISFQSASWIRIRLMCTGKDLEFEVANSMHPKSNTDPEHGRSGIGMKNVIERLKLLYPEKHNLLIQETGNEYVVKLNLY